MQWAPWNLCLWPGLPGLWQRGQTRGLVFALGFALLLNVTIWATVWRPIGATSGVLLVAWAGIAGCWVVSAWNSHRQWVRQAALPKSPQLEDWFREAQQQTLKGHWIEAEARLLKILEVAPADVEARLLLANVYRRSNRREESREQLRELSLIPAAERWRRERELEARRLDASATSDAPGGPTDRPAATAQAG